MKFTAAMRAADSLSVSGHVSEPGCSLAFGEVRHRRIRPMRHAFRYPAYFIRVDGATLERGRSGNLLFGLNRGALLSIRLRDHGRGEDTLDWLRDTLSRAGVRADGSIWLHAFPRVLGHTFKPVSFWFCHRADSTLAAVIAEVNNTFGERHCYLLANADRSPLRQGQQLTADKVFHVSPFNGLGGGYRFRFMVTDERGIMRIDYDDDEGPLLLTSLSGRFEPLDMIGLLKALLGYPMFTLGVVIRIHWHALRLWLRRVPFHRKPTPPRDFVTGGPT